MQVDEDILLGAASVQAGQGPVLSSDVLVGVHGDCRDLVRGGSSHFRSGFTMWA